MISSPEALQQLLDEVPKAKWYSSDGLLVPMLVFGITLVDMNKSDTYSVEAENAELLH